MISSKRLFRTYLLLGSVSLFSTAAMAIDPPSSAEGAEVAQSLVKWEWTRVPGAVNYEVTVDGVNSGLTRDPQFFSGNLWAGEHSMRVRSIGADGSYSGFTETVKINVSANFSSSSAQRSYVEVSLAQPPPARNHQPQPNLAPLAFRHPATLAVLKAATGQSRGNGMPYPVRLIMKSLSTAFSLALPQALATPVAISGLGSIP